ncbi:MarR family winged helix-turn-helix transcriptional regulator [Streptomonospora wellingtoniae]|uniref:MarR family transcriptional regulator n=1 Tax=Streptomonospora wellingtoniae TaxID=3075544 RepID=A0ABU2L0Y1_9ACTN|nr:MarR family transcriptional regulator [Streptomonospora sp. DSM 45055]MDT0304993.1 MarR family transcriptional regulator [Streptomonospora sp. DSM 45055]
MAEATRSEPGGVEALVRLAHVVDRVFTDVARRHELTPQQARLLCLLVDGPVGMGDLGRRLNLEKSSLTGLIDRVERRGLAARNRDGHDRRACRIGLTEEGVRLAHETHGGVTDRLEHLAAELDPAQRDGLRSAVDRLLAESEAAEPS